MGAALGADGDLAGVFAPALAVLGVPEVLLAHALGHAHGQLGRNVHHQSHGGHGQIAAVEADLVKIRTVDDAIFAKALHLAGEVQAGQVLALGERAVFDALRIGHE